MSEEKMDITSEEFATKLTEGFDEGFRRGQEQERRRILKKYVYFTTRKNHSFCGHHDFEEWLEKESGVRR